MVGDGIGVGVVVDVGEDDVDVGVTVFVAVIVGDWRGVACDVDVTCSVVVEVAQLVMPMPPHMIIKNSLFSRVSLILTSLLGRFSESPKLIPS